MKAQSSRYGVTKFDFNEGVQIGAVIESGEMEQAVPVAHLTAADLWFVRKRFKRATIRQYL